MITIMFTEEKLLPRRKVLEGYRIIGLRLMTIDSQDLLSHARRIDRPPRPGQNKSEPAPKADESLDNNLKRENSINQNRQIDRLQDRYKPMQQGVNPF